jgi:hypothetical protein
MGAAAGFMSMQRLKEKTAKGKFTIHVSGALNDDRTLCGYAYEGSCMETEGDHGVEPVERGKVNCPMCLTIINYCKSIPPEIARRHDR